MSDTQANLTRTHPRSENRHSKPRTILVPATDLHATDNGWMLEADLPGVTPDGLRLNVEQGMLTIEADTLSPADGTLLHQEFEPVVYRRRFELGDQVDAEHIDARLENGVLAVTLKRAEAARPRKIDVKVQG